MSALAIGSVGTIGYLLLLWIGLAHLTPMTITLTMRVMLSSTYHNQHLSQMPLTLLLPMTLLIMLFRHRLHQMTSCVRFCSLSRPCRLSRRSFRYSTKQCTPNRHSLMPSGFSSKSTSLPHLRRMRRHIRRLVVECQVVLSDDDSAMWCCPLQLLTSF